MEKFNLILRNDISIGTSQQGRVRASYKQLISIFGEPNTFSPELGESPDDKVRVQWTGQLQISAPDIVEVDVDVVFTIYDYKDHDTPIGDLNEFNVGGTRQGVIYALKLAAELNDWPIEFRYR